MNHNLLILGAGQYGMVAKETAQAMGYFEKIDFLDDNSELAIGKLQEYERFSAVYSYAFVTMGNAALRLELIGKLEEVCYTVAVLVNPKAAIAPSAQLHKGTIVEAMAVVNSNATVAIGCIISAGAVVNHDSFIGDGCHINCNATVPSNAILLAGTTVPYGKLYQPEIRETPKRYPENYSFEVGV